jgi:hypothetical protein
MHYRHTQFGALVTGILAMGMAVCLVKIAFLGITPGSLAVLSLLLTCLLTFTALTIEINETSLIWYYNFGLIYKKVPLADIAQTVPVRNPWYYGWGIHLTPHGWLYNVSGSQAVEIMLKNGTSFRLGSDEPEALVDALARRPGSPPLLDR